MIKYFILKFFNFLLFSFFTTFILIFSFNKVIEGGPYFKIKKDTKYLVLGHSHPECAFNDSIIDNLENFGKSAESYFYTYIKLKSLIKSNRQIKTVFLEFSNFQIDDNWDSLYTWSDEMISWRYPMYSPIFEPSDLFFILKKNIKSVINSQSLSLTNNIKFLISKETNYPKFNQWGGYLYLIRDKTDSLLSVLSSDSLLNFNKMDKMSTTNIHYLLKIVEFCKENKVKIFLIRSPFHPKYPGFKNESYFQNILNAKLYNLEFLDFKNFPLENNEYGDLNHLNYKGSEKFSHFFKKLLKMNILSSNKKQEMIDNEIAMIKFKSFNK